MAAGFTNRIWSISELLTPLSQSRGREMPHDYPTTTDDPKLPFSKATFPLTAE
jgi:hypothetical protein